MYRQCAAFACYDCSWLVLWNKTYLEVSLNIDVCLVDIFLGELLI